jgi:hypothetical protein
MSRYHRQQDFFHKVKMVCRTYRSPIAANFGLPETRLTLYSLYNRVDAYPVPTLKDTLSHCY